MQRHVVFFDVCFFCICKAFLVKHNASIEQNQSFVMKRLQIVLSGFAEVGLIVNKASGPSNEELKIGCRPFS